MSSSIGQNIKLTIFGQSHSAAIGMTLQGIPAGIRLDRDALEAFLSRRAPGRNEYSTARSEADIPEFVAGLKQDVFCGTPITAIIRNTDTRSSDYDELAVVPRPGHADYTAQIKFGGNQDVAGGGHFSGRMTAPLCIAGGICKQILEGMGISVISRISSIGGICDEGELTQDLSHKEFPVVNDEKGMEMRQLIAEAKSQKDSVGGIIECCILGLPAGLGDPMFDGMENRIAQIVFGIPAVKGIEFGSGFASAKMFGSENNDAFYYENGEVRTKTNHCGGILGGITNGMPLTFRVAVKPTPSIASKQDSINMKTGENAVLEVKGRHDPCIVPRALPCVEAAAAIAVYDAYLEQKKFSL